MVFREDIRASQVVEINANLIAYMVEEHEECPPVDQDKFDQRIYVLTTKIENRICRALNHFEQVPSIQELFLDYYMPSEADVVMATRTATEERIYRQSSS